jgi:hypothetical protein
MLNTQLGSRLRGNGVKFLVLLINMTTTIVIPANFDNRAGIQVR